MLLYHSSLIRLEYDPASDILSMDWPDVQEFFVADVARELAVLIDTIKHYDIKKLLIDTSNAIVQVNSEDYLSFVAPFVAALKGTRLQKLARIGTNNPDREKVSAQAREDSELEKYMQFHTFKTKNEALSWLVA